MLKSTSALLGVILMTACATSSGLDPSNMGTSVMNRNAVVFEGPEMVAVVAYRQGKYSVAQDWLILAIEMTSPRGSGPTVVRHDDISVYTPDGRRLPLISQEEFVRNFVKLRIPMDRTLAYQPLLYRVEPNRIPSDRWFFAIDMEKIAYDELPINSSESFLGPLIFRVPQGVQPGRWRLVIELPESRPDIPFVIELKGKR